MKNFDLTGKTVVVTGASKGIGEAAARAFAAHGAKVALLARSEGKITEIASEIGDTARAYPCDVADYGAVQSAIAKTAEELGTVDILVGNAGVIDPIGHLGDTSPAAWGKLIDINVKGVMYGIHAVLPEMLSNGGGTIITVSSGAAYNPVEGWSAYCSSKAAALMTTRAVDLEYRSRGIRMMGLSPGTVATDMQRTIAASGVNVVSQIPWENHIPPEWAAEALLWMCLPEADTYLGADVRLRDEDILRKVGLI
ncbi:SDR family oxidoreductase [Cognatiyoonia sp.]|uniref:SDR family oxidoreductase n=1 Tax=Cognatiyoonia sp. TaxID=2211652 RepID=UPI003F6A48EE